MFGLLLCFLCYIYLITHHHVYLSSTSPRKNLGTSWSRKKRQRRRPWYSGRRSWWTPTWSPRTLLPLNVCSSPRLTVHSFGSSTWPTIYRPPKSSRPALLQRGRLKQFPSGELHVYFFFSFESEKARKQQESIQKGLILNSDGSIVVGFFFLMLVCSGSERSRRSWMCGWPCSTWRTCTAQRTVSRKFLSERCSSVSPCQSTSSWPTSTPSLTKPRYAYFKQPAWSPKLMHKTFFA